MQEHYPTQESCVELLEDLIWSFEPTCPRCQSKDLDGVMLNHYNSKSAYLCRDCEQLYTVTTNTMFQHSEGSTRQMVLCNPLDQDSRTNPRGLTTSTLEDVGHLSAYLSRISPQDSGGLKDWQQLSVQQDLSLQPPARSQLVLTCCLAKCKNTIQLKCTVCTCSTSSCGIMSLHALIARAKAFFTIVDIISTRSMVTFVILVFELTL